MEAEPVLVMAVAVVVDIQAAAVVLIHHLVAAAADHIMVDPIKQIQQVFGWAMDR
jgi:hypothetical protein